MWTNSAPRFNAGSWLLWLAAAMLAALLTRNPYYLALTMGAVILVHKQLKRTQNNTHHASRITHHALRVLIGLTLIMVMFKSFSLHLGTTVLFTLPEWLPALGGPITLEAIVLALLDALSLLTVLAVFSTFSAGADYYAILRALPPFLHQVGLITSIAITFVPKTIDRFAEIREAQALRGHKIRRVGDLLPLIMPLLAGGMERSLDLAEAMESRGFSRTPAGSRRLRPIVAQSGIAASIGLILVGGVLPAVLSREDAWIGWTVIALGAGLLILTLWAMGKGTKRVRYRRAVWRERDTALAAASIGVIAFLLAYKTLDPSAFVYYPFPSIYPPLFDPIMALAILALAAPVPILASISKETKKSASKQVGLSPKIERQPTARLKHD